MRENHLREEHLREQILSWKITCLILAGLLAICLFAKPVFAEMYDATTDPDIQKGRIIIGEESTTTTIPEEEELTPEQKQHKEDTDKYPNATCFETNPDSGRALPCERRPMQMPKVVPQKPDGDKIFIQYWVNTPEDDKNELRHDYKLKHDPRMNLIPDSEYFIITDGTDPQMLINLIENNPKFRGVVRYSETVGGGDFKPQANITPRDNYYRSQKWYFNLTGIPQMLYYVHYPPNPWRVTGWKRPVIAIIDTGYPLSNKDMPDYNIKLGCDRFTPSTICKPSIDPSYYGSHGMVVTSVMAALLNNVGIAGIDSLATFYEIRACNYEHCDPDGLTQGVYEAVANHADVINFSIAGYTDNQKLHEALQYALAMGVLITCGAGNDGYNIAVIKAYPASWAECMTTVASGKDSQLVRFVWSDGSPWASNFGSGSVSMSAPGIEVLAYDSSDVYRVVQVQGTSVSNAFITIAAAIRKDKCNKEKAPQLRQAIQRTAKPITGCPVYMCGWGEVDFYALIKSPCIV